MDAHEIIHVRQQAMLRALVGVLVLIAGVFPLFLSFSLPSFALSTPVRIGFFVVGAVLGPLGLWLTIRAVLCPGCGQHVGHLHFERCPHCGVAFTEKALSSMRTRAARQARLGREGSPSPNGVQAQRPRPAAVRVGTGERLVFIERPSTKSRVAMAAAVLFLPLVVAWELVSWDRWILAAGLLAVAGYAALAAGFNRTILEVDRAGVHVRRRPLPTAREILLPAAALEQIDTVFINKEKDLPPWHVVAVMRDGTRHLLSVMDTEDEALLLEGRIESALGIEDRPADTSEADAHGTVGAGWLVAAVVLVVLVVVQELYLRSFAAME